MSLSDDPVFAAALTLGGRAQELLSLNGALAGHGLRLTRENAEEILAERSRALRSQGRVELDTSVTQAIVRRLAESPFVTQQNLVETVADLYETFHFIKNATSDFVGDGELLDAILLCYETVCRGSAELLMGKGAEKIIENFNSRKELTDFAQPEEEETWSFDE